MDDYNDGDEVMDARCVTLDTSYLIGIRTVVIMRMMMMNDG